MSDRFYVPELVGQDSVIIQGTEARHIAKVMRMNVGDQVILFDGLDNQATAKISEVSKNTIRLDVLQLSNDSREAATSVTVATAIPKGDRLKFMVEKLTEIGVARIIPVIFKRSSVIPKDSTVDKMRRYVLEASKQCERNRLLEVTEPIKSVELFANPDLHYPDCNRIVCRPRVPLKLAAAIGTSTGPFLFGVGPEGGIEDSELAIALQHGWSAANFGPRILRTETAAIFASAIALANQ